MLAAYFGWLCKFAHAKGLRVLEDLQVVKKGSFANHGILQAASFTSLQKSALYRETKKRKQKTARMSTTQRQTSTRCTTSLVFMKDSTVSRITLEGRSPHSPPVCIPHPTHLQSESLHSLRKQVALLLTTKPATCTVSELGQAAWVQG